MPILAESNADAKSFVVFDVETSGLSPTVDELVEIAAEKLRGREVVSRFHSLIVPSRPLTPEAISIHGITNELLAQEGRPVSDVIPEFFSFIESAVLVGHNVEFDMSFLRAYASKLSLPQPANQLLDTCEIARRHLIIPSYSLERVATYFGITNPQAHRAASDVETTREVFFRLLDRALANKGIKR